MRIAIIASLLIGLLAPAVQAADDATIGAFALGRGKAAAQASVYVQHRLRELAPTTGTHQLVDLQTLLDGDELSDRAEAVSEAKKLLEEGKEAYEQLDLEQAQAKFELALKKFEYGFGYLDKTALLVEALMYLGASWVLVGEPDKAEQIFKRAADLPGRKTMNTELFPPNIIEIFEKASARSQGDVKVSLFSVPEGAAIFVDDVYRGGSPLTVDGLSPGKHLVRAAKDGYRPWGGKIAADPKKLRRFKLTLKPTIKRQVFSEKFRGLAGELIKGKVGPGIAAMGQFMGAKRLVAVVIEGEPAALTMRGFMCEISDSPQHVQVEEVLDATSSAYEERLKEFLLKLLTAEPVRDEFAEAEGDKGEGYDEGAAAAAALLAGKGEGDQGEGDQGEGDQGEGDQGAGDQGAGDQGAGDQGTEVAKAGDGAGDVSAEEDKDKKAEEAAKVVEGTRGQDDQDEAFSFSWGYLQNKWWFWSAVGVVAAGAATGIYFATAPAGGDNKGSLVIGLH